MAKLIDWLPIERYLADISNAAKGEPAWPPLALFKALLLAVWYDLSDVKPTEALDDRASFCGFSASEATPERTAFVRFRKALTTRGLARALFDAVTAQLKTKAEQVKTGTLVDATIIASSSKDDDEARWVKHKGKPAVHGFKAHVGANADTALVEEIAITPANVHDGKGGIEALPSDPGEVFADSAYRGSRFETAVRAKGAHPGLLPRAYGDVTRPKRASVSTPGTGRSIVFALGSRRSSGPESGPMACAACAGGDWPKRHCRSNSPPSPTT